MRQFTKNILAFGLLSLLVLLVSIFVSKLLCSSLINTSISKEKNVLILGTSQLEGALNDKIITQSKNMAQSGTCYFYTYQKAKTILNSNPHIDTLVLGFSYIDISENRDNWFYGDKNIQAKMRNYFFMFGLTDYLDLLNGNTKAVLVNTPRVIINNLKLIFTGLNSLGGFKPLKRDRLLKAKANHEMEMATYPYKFNLSENEIKYLVKTYDLCQLKNVKVILLFTPIHPVLKSSQLGFHEGLCETYQQQLSNATFIDHSRYALADSLFSDLGHLNYKGAKAYSEYINTIGFSEPYKSCTPLIK